MADERPYAVLLVLPQSGLTEGQGADIVERMRFINTRAAPWVLLVAADNLRKPEGVDPVVDYLVKTSRMVGRVEPLPALQGQHNECRWLYEFARERDVDEVWCCMATRQERRGRAAKIYAIAQDEGVRLDATGKWPFLASVARKAALKFKKIPPWVEGSQVARYLDIGAKAKAGADMRKGKTWNGKF